MIPVRLSLKGFLSYQQAAELDFSGFELACISGANGAGKSSLLDAITWAVFGRARKREDDALINSDSSSTEVTFEFTYENDRYLIQRSKVRNKTTVLEFKLLNSQNEWVNLSEHALRETEKRIEQILRMDYDTFINTCFFLQGKADQFAQQPAGKRKEILSSILNLEKWEEFRLAAASQRRQVENEITSYNAWLGEIENELALEEERRARLKQTNRDLEVRSALRKEKENLLENARRQSDLLKEQEKLLTAQREHLQEMERQKEESQQLLQSRKDELDSYAQVLATGKIILEDYTAFTKIRQELETINQLAASFFNLDQQRLEQEKVIGMERTRLEATRQNLLEQQEKINIKRDKSKILKQKMASLDDEMKGLETAIETKAEIQAAIQSFQQLQADLLAENKRLRSEMNELNSHIQQLRSAKANCPLCGRELTDEHRSSLLVGFEMEGKKHGDQFRQNEASINDYNQQINQAREKITLMEKSEEQLRLLARNRAILEAEIQSATDEVEKWEKSEQPQLNEIQDQLEKMGYAPEAQKRLKEIMRELTSLGYDRQQHEQIRQKELAARESEERMRTLEKARASSQPLQREMDSIRKRLSDLDDKMRHQEELIKQASLQFTQSTAGLPDLVQMENELNGIRNEENELRMEAGRAEQEVAVLASLKTKKDDLMAKKQEKARLVSRLEMLERAFGRNGVPALLIEQALPEIEASANRILDQLSKGSISLTFATQRERKNKKEEGAIQTLDILLTDASGTREYELFSGGEAFRINFAIRLALSQALAKRAGARLQTLVIDEGFGSQDADGRQRLIEAINQVMQTDSQLEGDNPVSDIRKILVITHLDELKDAFPARIEVEKTGKGSTLQVLI